MAWRGRLFAGRQARTASANARDTRGGTALPTSLISARQVYRARVVKEKEIVRKALQTGAFPEGEGPILGRVEEVAGIVEVGEHGGGRFIPQGRLNRPEQNIAPFRSCLPSISFRYPFLSSAAISGPMAVRPESRSISSVGSGLPLGMLP